MLSREQNERLTRIDGDTPMGVFMREHRWIPALLSIELVADGAPRRVRLVGKDYVAFRDTNGDVGFLDEGCPHRNASLVLARNEECGLRCIFHGWKVDVTGQVVEAPTHSPNPEAFAAKITTRRYPTVEGGGLVWVWLGESEAPPFPHLPFTVLPDSHVWVTATPCACNWLQGVEATLDTAHIGTLHKAYITAYSESDSGSSIKNSLDSLAPRYDVILVGDLFYERETAQRALAFLERHAKLGTKVFIGDPGRTYLPTDRLAKQCEYSVPVTRDLEDQSIKRTAVFTLI